MNKPRRHRRRHTEPHRNGVMQLDGNPLARACLDVPLRLDEKDVLPAGGHRDLSWLESFLKQPASPAASDRRAGSDGARGDPRQAGSTDPSTAAESTATHIAPDALVPTEESLRQMTQPLPHLEPLPPAPSLLGEKCLTGDEGVPLASFAFEEMLPPPETVRAGTVAAANHTSRNNESTAELLVRLTARARVFRGSDGRSYAEVPVGGHREIHDLCSSSFEYWLIRTFRREHKALPGADALSRLVRALQAEAAALPAAEPVWVRAAGASAHAALPDDAVGAPAAQPHLPAEPGSASVYYLDLGDSTHDAVEIRTAGCQIVTRPPVSFRRPKGMRPFPRPEWGGSIDLLRKYVNLRDRDFPLLVAWMTGALRPVGPYPTLILSGEQGSAKSTTARVVRRLTDPNAVLLRSAPRSQRDLMVEAHNTWVLAYDNVSSVSTALSDAVCRVATGGGLSTRALYSDDDETLLEVQRPAILTGIDDFVRRGDLIDRCVFLHLPAIRSSRRRLQEAFWGEFKVDYPSILGSLLTAVAGGLRMLPEVQLPALPRMADFARWGEAVSLGLGWQPGCFVSQYIANRRDACAVALEECPVVEALRQLLARFRSMGPCVGTPSQILHSMTRFMPENVTRSAQWPKNARALSSRLRRIAPQLREFGIHVDFDRRRTGRVIRVSADKVRLPADRSVRNGDEDPSQGPCDAKRDASVTQNSIEW
jgi:hypothetical protein